MTRERGPLRTSRGRASRLAASRHPVARWIGVLSVFALCAVAGAAAGATAPLLLAIPMLDPMIITFLVTGAAFVLFVTEALPPDVTALAAAATLMLTGVLSPAEGFSGFSNQATVTVLSMFIIAAGVQRTGLINVLAHRVMGWTGRSPTRFLVLLVLLAGGVSMFINNTPVVAILIPLVITVASRLGKSPSKFLIPLAFAAVLGGTMTLIGTSTNLLGSGLSEGLGFGSFSMFLLFPVGSILFIVGVAYLVIFGRHLLPERHEATEHEERFQLRDYVCEVVVQPGSPLVGSTVDRSGLKSRFDIDIIRVFRDRITIDQPLVGIEIREGDILLIRAARDQLLQVRDTEGLAILPEVTHGLPGEEGDVALVEAIITPGSSIEGSTLEESLFRQRYDAVVLAIKKRERLFLRRFSSLRLEHGDTLLLSTTNDTIEGLKKNPDLIIAEELEVEKFRRSRIPLVLAIIAGMVGSVTVGVFPMSVAALGAVLLMVVTGCLTVHELHESVRWDVVFLLAGIIPLGIALETTGAAAVIAGTIAETGRWLPPLGVLAVMAVTTTLLTQVMTNNASVALMLPISVEVALVSGYNPLTFILATTLAASLGFMSPVGYQANLMVYAPGEYRFVDYLKVGTPLTVILLAVMVYAVNFYWPVMG